MGQGKPEKRNSWQQAAKGYLDPRAVTMLFLGFSAGLPFMLIFSSLSVWLREAGVERATVTYFSWAALGYSFKFVWAPLVDTLPIPGFTKWLGRRRSWLLLSQAAIATAVVCMAMVDPAESEQALTYMACFAVFLGFSAATQDIVIDAYRIESAEADLQATLSALYIAGYRVAMLASGAGSLVLAAHFGTTTDAYDYSAWQLTYCLMAGLMSVGMLVTILRPEPQAVAVKKQYTGMEYLRFLALFSVMASSFAVVFFYGDDLLASVVDPETSGPLLGFAVQICRLGLAGGVAAVVGFVAVQGQMANRDMLQEAYVAPIVSFFERFGAQTAWRILLLVGTYRISDIVLGVISNVFYLDIGFTKPEIASVVKTFGLIATLLGGFLGGLLTSRMGTLTMMLWGAVLSAATNLLFMILAWKGADLGWLYGVVFADNLVAGLASAAFVAFLAGLTTISFTAIQYAIFSSMMLLVPKLLGGYSGSIVDSIGYPAFFVVTALMGVPVVVVVWMCRNLDLKAR